MLALKPYYFGIGTNRPVSGSARRKDVSRRGDATRLLGQLVKINSVNPFEGNGEGEAEVAEFIRARLSSYGLSAKLQKVRGKRSNVIAIMKGTGRGGRTLMLNGHIDTVGVEGMTIDPFGAKVDAAGRLHGRGSSDMKGSIASMIAALKGLVESGTKLRGDVIFTGVIDEEYLSIGTSEVIKEYSSDGAIVGEPTGLNIGLAHRGYVWAEVEVRGKASHGSVPEKGVDAIVEMGRLIAELPALQREYTRLAHPLLGNPKIHASTIEGGTEWSVVPESCRMRVERRTLPGEKGDVLVRELERKAASISRTHPTFRASVRKFFEQEPMEVSRRERVVRSVSSSYRSVTGKRPKYVGLTYWADSALLANKAGIPTVLFGPGDIGVAHSADEYVPLDEVERAARIFASSIERFCG